MKKYFIVFALILSGWVATGTGVYIYDKLSVLRDVTISSPSSGQSLTYNSSTSKWNNTTVSSITSNQKIGVFGVALDGGGSALTTGQKGYVTIPYAGTITAWNITCDGSGPTCTWDIWKVATGTALPTVSNTIMGTKPALSTGNAIHSTTLTNWTTSVAANDIIGFNLDATATATKNTLTIEVTKT